MSYTPIVYNNFYSTSSRVEVFNYYKSFIVIISSFVMFILFNYKIFILKYELRKSKLNIVVGIICFILLLSTLLSDYKSIAFFGNHDKFEGTLTWISYIIIFFVLFNIDIDKKYYKFYYLSLIPFIVINFITSFSYINKTNLLENTYINNLMGGNLQGEFITTIYNENFGSAIAALVFCTSFMYLLLQDKLLNKIFIYVIMFISYATVLCMKSLVGFISILIVAPLILFVALKLGTFKSSMIDVFITLTINNIIFKILISKDINIYNESFSIFSKFNFLNILVFLVLLSLIILFSSNIKLNKKYIDRILILCFFIIFIFFIVYSYFFKDNEELISSELYNNINVMTTYRLDIWNRSIEVIKENLILGNGMDTFPYTFIEKDSQKGIFSGNTYIDRPHSFYLSILSGIGIFGFIPIILIPVYIIKNSIYFLLDSNRLKEIYVFSVGIIVYLIQGITNDTIVGTSIIFWILCGISCNIIYKENNN